VPTNDSSRLARLGEAVILDLLLIAAFLTGSVIDSVLFRNRLRRMERVIAAQHMALDCLLRMHGVEYVSPEYACGHQEPAVKN
jgi:hypothetical protein